MGLTRILHNQHRTLSSTHRKFFTKITGKFTTLAFLISSKRISGLPFHSSDLTYDVIPSQPQMPKLLSHTYLYNLTKTLTHVITLGEVKETY